MSQTSRTPLLTARMVFTEETIHTFTAMQYNLFRKKQKYLTASVAFALIVTGLLLGANTWQGVLPLLIGCVLITNPLAAPKHIANSLSAQFKGKLPSISYRFYPDRMDVSTSPVPIHYASLTQMAEDNQHLYLFLTSETGYMVQKSSVKGGNGYKSLAQLLESGAGKPIRRYSGLFSVTLRSMLKGFRTN